MILNFKDELLRLKVLGGTVIRKELALGRSGLMGCFLMLSAVLCLRQHCPLALNLRVVVRKGMKGRQCHEDGDHGVSSLPSFTLSPGIHEADELLTEQQCAGFLRRLLGLYSREPGGIRGCV